MFFKRFTNPRCRTCGKRSSLQDLGQVAPTHHGTFHTSKFSLVYCPRCETVFLTPAPTPEDLRVLYQDSDQFSDDHYTAADQVEKILEYYDASLTGHRLLPGNHTRVLEIGAGFAWVSRASKNLDPTTVTVAQDLSSECATRCDWVDLYHVGPLAQMPPQASFDLISMTHVIEHLVNPRAMLEDICLRLSPHGKLFVTAPYRPRNWEPGKGIEAWRDYTFLHVPAHVTYFSRKWFEQVAPRLGMRILHWDDNHAEGEAFELVLERTTGSD